MRSIRARLRHAAERAGRDPAGVRLVGVVKTVPSEIVSQAVALGLGDLGENRVQEAREKIAAVGRRAARWHMIGHLQRNKAARALELFDRIHSVDGRELAETLSARARATGVTPAVMLEVNVSGDPAKSGVAPEQAAALARVVVGLPGLDLDGLMTVGPPVADPEQSRPWFAALRALRDRLEQTLGHGLPELSMGMSGDFEVAVGEGSTMVRIGTALFGARG